MSQNVMFFFLNYVKLAQIYVLINWVWL